MQQQLTGTLSRGFTLVEVLVALLVLSIGLLGIAGLQLKSLHDNQDAYVRLQASILASDIIERMRANRAAARAGEYNIALTDTPASGASLSELDVKAWRDRLKLALPAGLGAVSVDTDQVMVIIQWDDRRDGPPPSFEYQTRL